MSLASWSNKIRNLRDRARPQQRRGVMLLTVTIAVMLMTILVMEFYYSSRVKLALAVNARDEVKAYYNAKSGINLIRLTLNFQYELEQEEGLIGQATERSNFQLWEYLSLFLPTFVSARVEGGNLGSLDLEETGAIGFGDIEGDIIFDRPEPEEGKINLNSFAGSFFYNRARRPTFTLRPAFTVCL
ncbi:MAG: hypothetical protein KC561_09830 [Myxococcales bacterium]|nr:hypothetical protein [Myxococcales bacterium]